MAAKLNNSQLEAFTDVVTILIDLARQKRAAAAAQAAPIKPSQTPKGRQHER